MQNFKKGDILKLSKEGVCWVYKYATLKQIESAKAWRFEFRCFSRHGIGCIAVKRMRNGIPTYYQQYHESFLERTEIT